MSAFPRGGLTHDQPQKQGCTPPGAGRAQKRRRVPPRLRRSRRRAWCSKWRRGGWRAPEEPKREPKRLWRIRLDGFAARSLSATATIAQCSAILRPYARNILTCRVQQASHGALDFFILAFAGVAEDDVTVLVDDVLSRPVLIAPGVPGRRIIVLCHRIADAMPLQRGLHMPADRAKRARRRDGSRTSRPAKRNRNGSRNRTTQVPTCTEVRCNPPQKRTSPGRPARPFRGNRMALP